MGYYQLERTGNELENQEVCVFIDESIRMGTERLLLVLVCPAWKLERGNLTAKDVFAKEMDYQAFIKDIGKVQAKLAMGEDAYLRPPKQRAKSRFLNQSKLVYWSDCVLSKWAPSERKHWRN